MSRLFLHYEGDPSYTLKLVLGQTPVATIAEATEVRKHQIGLDLFR